MTPRDDLAFSGIDPVAGWERSLEFVVAPTGQAARVCAATEGTGSAWMTRSEVVEVVAFLTAWLERTATRHA